MSNLLESFFILFASDAGDVQEGADKATDSTEKLDKKLKETDASATKTGESFAALASRAATMLAPIIGLSALKGAVLDFAAGADAAGKMAQSLRMDVEELQAWQGAASRAGGSAEGLAGSVKSLNTTLYDMQRGVGSEAGFMLLRMGISAREAGGGLKTADKVLLELSGKMQGLSREKAMRLGEKLGLDEGTILLLQQGKKGVEALITRQKELGVYSKKEAEDSKKFNITLADMKQAWNSVVGVVAGAVLPIFMGIHQGFTQIALGVRKHKELITGFFIGLSLIMGLLAIKTGIAFAPFLLFAATVLLLGAAFAVAYDDVMNFLEGNDSMIGRLSKDYPGLADLVMDIVEALKFLWAIGKAVGTLLVESITNPKQAFEKFMGTVGPLLDSFSERFPLLGQAIRDVGTIFKALFEIAAPIMKKLMTLVGDVLGWIFDKLGKVMGLLGKGINWIASKLRGDEGKQPDEKFNMDEYLDEEDNEDGSAAPKVVKVREPVTEDGPSPMLPLTSPLQASSPEAPPPARRVPGLPSEAEPQPQALPETPSVPPLVHTPWNPPQETAVNLGRGKAALAQTSIPLSSMPGGREGGDTTIEKTYQIKVEKVEVNTQATDAEGMAKGAGGALERELRAAIDQFDDGVAA